MQQLGQYILDFSNFIWGTPLLILLMGGGLFFLIYIKFIPLKYIKHSIKILSGKYDNEEEKGDINHFEALSTALAGTIGMGNIGGVAIAITTGGPGAIFWMWISAFVGIATKYFEATLSVMFRGKDDKGNIQGGPMYVIVEGLGKNWRPLAIVFSIFAMVGLTPMFNVNQLNIAIHDMILTPIFDIQPSYHSNLSVGIILSLMVVAVVFGGIKRVGKVASKLVPFMVIVYFGSVAIIVLKNYTEIIPSLILIFKDAFSAKAVLGGSIGSLIILGARRAAFSNEAGVGTASMAHGAAKTDEPVREGLVAMLGPIIDTMIVCTLTAIAIIISGVWNTSQNQGIALTAEAFEISIPVVGKFLIAIAVFGFSFTTLFAYPYFGKKSFSFVFGTKYSYLYTFLYILSIPIATVVSLDIVLAIIDSAYALMTFPTMISALILAPKVKKASLKYFSELKKNKP